MGDWENFQDAEDKEYRLEFQYLRPIFAKHFPKLDERKLFGIIHYYMACYENGLGEVWSYKNQQKHLSSLRSSLSRAASAINDIHDLVIREINGNLALPMEVLNGQCDCSNCPSSAFENAIDETLSVKSTFKDLLDHHRRIDLAIKYTQDALPKGIPIRVRNMKAWTIVEAAAIVSRNYPEDMNVPSKTNSSGPFWKLLRDLFSHHSCSSNIDSTFNEWWLKLDSKRESFHLLPID